MAITSVCVDDNLLKEMRNHPGVNWSRIFRAAVRDKLGMDAEPEKVEKTGRIKKRDLHEIIETLALIVEKLEDRIEAVENSIKSEEI